jgi:hypothetical protein
MAVSLDGTQIDTVTLLNADDQRTHALAELHLAARGFNPFSATGI